VMEAVLTLGLVSVILGTASGPRASEASRPSAEASRPSASAPTSRWPIRAGPGRFTPEVS
jgi:hypothetical protein